MSFQRWQYWAFEVAFARRAFDRSILTISNIHFNKDVVPSVKYMHLYLHIHVHVCMCECIWIFRCSSHGPVSNSSLLLLHTQGSSRWCSGTLSPGTHMQSCPCALDSCILPSLLQAGMGIWGVCQVTEGLSLSSFSVSISFPNSKQIENKYIFLKN